MVRQAQREQQQPFNPVLNEASASEWMGRQSQDMAATVAALQAENEKLRQQGQGGRPSTISQMDLQAAINGLGNQLAGKVEQAANGLRTEVQGVMTKVTGMEAAVAGIQSMAAGLGASLGNLPGLLMEQAGKLSDEEKRKFAKKASVAITADSYLPDAVHHGIGRDLVTVGGVVGVALAAERIARYAGWLGQAM